MRPIARRNGFTLIELLIVIAIIGIISALLIPNLLDSIHKSKQKRTMSDQKIIGTAMMSWLTDNAGGAAAAGQDVTSVPIITASDLEDELVPQYIQDFTHRDSWGHAFDFRLNVADPNRLEVMVIRSTGRDGVFEADDYTAGAFDPTDYDQDLVWMDGGFVRWPQKLDNQQGD
jgi:prepilin-type N-terminal cleavage/methylation domain-containing protein